MPGDLTATVHWDDRGAIEGVGLGTGPSPGGVDGVVLDVDDRVGTLMAGDLGVDLTLVGPALVVLGAYRGVVCDAQIFEFQASGMVHPSLRGHPGNDLGRGGLWGRLGFVAIAGVILGVCHADPW